MAWSLEACLIILLLLMLSGVVREEIVPAVLVRFIIELFRLRNSTSLRLLVGGATVPVSL